MIFTQTIVFNVSMYGQKIHTIKETAFRQVESDSILRYTKFKEYDFEGRLIISENEYFNSNRKKTKEEVYHYDSLNNTSIKTVNNYQNADYNTEKTISRFRKYGVKNSEHQLFSQSVIDSDFEIIREDTFTYSGENIIKKCVYNYQGNTSLMCDYYHYNKKNLLKRWQTYSIWTTIDFKGEVTEKKTKRRDYKYKYDRDSNLIKSYGKFYKTRYIQTIKTNKKNNLKSDKTTVFRKKDIKIQSNSEKKKTRYKTISFKDEEIKLFNNKMLVEHIKRSSGKDFYNKKFVYSNDTLMKEILFINNKLSENITYEYSETNKKSYNSKYDKNGKIKYILEIIYNDRNQSVLEKQTNNNITISELITNYNEFGKITSSSLSYDKNRIFEKTVYIYTYY